MKDRELQKLIKKTMAKAGHPKTAAKTYTDPTLKATNSNDLDPESEALEIFREMKKREF